MPRYNGNGPHYCKNCGGSKGIHRDADMACPSNGEAQTGENPPAWMDTYFKPQGYEQFVSLESTDSRTIFDDYFLAALTGISAIFGTNVLTQKEVEELFPGIVITCAFDVAKAAMKKRDEYFSEVKE